MSFKCNICDKIFKKKCHLIDHLNRKYPCKSKNIVDGDDYTLIIDKLKTENENLKKELETHKLLKQNDVNILNNGNLTINNINNINIIQIVNHGEEDYQKINMNEIIKKLNNPPALERVSSMIYYIHCNDEFPEYQNIYISDLSRGKMKIYKDGEWKNMESKPVVNALYDKIIEYYDDHSNDDIYSFIRKEASKTYPCNPNYTDKHRKIGINNTQNVLYDNRDRIKAIKIKKTITPLIK